MSEKDKKPTYTEALQHLTEKVEDVEDYVKSVDKKVDSIDDRERMLQKDLSRIHGLLEGRKEVQEETQKKRRWTLDRIGLVCTVVFSVLTLIWKIIEWWPK